MDIPLITSITDAKTGEMGQEYFATGKRVALRRWEEDACEFGETRCRNDEIVGDVLGGQLELDLDGESFKLHRGVSWLAPAGTIHPYRVIEPIIAIEATSPPVRFNDRDEPA